MSEPVILEALRTPIGKKDGALAAQRPDDLYAAVLGALTDRVRLDPTKVEDVITGCVTQAGEQGANIGRQAVLLSGLPRTVPAVTLSRMCGSSQQAVHFAAQAVAAGDAQYVIAGGVESMSRAPMFSDIKGGFETLNPRLLSKYEIVHQGESAERIAERFQLTREKIDDFSAESHRKAAHATREGWFRSQLVAVPGKEKVLETDEGVRSEVDRAKMAKLPAVFRKDGVVTAANSSQLSDGAAACLVADRDAAVAEGFRPRARFRARVVVAGDPTMQLMEVIPATRKALWRAGLSLKDVDLVEINEAFATVVLAWTQVLKADPEKVNVNGGAIAHGHPLGATGAALLAKLLYELERRDKQLGLQVMCIGHGMATATVIERI